MQKEDLKSLVTQMYEELIKNIDSQENTTQEQVLSYLLEATNSIATITDSEIGSDGYSKKIFINAYREIAQESISHYKSTNGRFEEIVSMHQDTIDEYSEILIDIPAITEKFNKIQSYMTEEITRANIVITQLSTQIKVLERTSNIDSLTKVFNRRALTTHLEKMCSKTNINNELHILMLDLDNFKMINDDYGHLTGDKVLIFIANMLKKTLRNGDKVFRYGGEEFVITLNRLNYEECLEVANRILELVSSNRLIYKGDSLSVTVSIGTTQYHVGDTPDSLIKRADKALYKSKDNGKNQINTETLNGN